LARHKNEEHQQKSETKKTNCFQCKFCEDSFDSKRELMKHRKKEHSDRVSVCWKFTSGECEYGIEKCWFNHSSSAKCEIKWKFCEQIFPNQYEFLTHPKQFHVQFVPPCRIVTNGTCNYTNENCWFNHKENGKINENNEKENEENREVIQKIIQLKEMNNLQ
jgi:hypothetical protein